MEVKNGGIKESNQNNEKKIKTVYYMIQVKCPSPYPYVRADSRCNNHSDVSAWHEW